MKKIILLILISLTLVTACISNHQNPTTLPPSPIPEEQIPDIVSGEPTVEPTLATLQLALYSPQTRTSLAEIDPIIDAVLKHDYPGIKEITRYLEIACVNPSGLGGPPACSEGESEGTLVSVVPFLGPEGHHLRQTEFENWEGPDVLGFLAAYRTSAGTYSDPAYPAGDYALVFLLPNGLETITLQISEGQIVRFDYRFAGMSNTDLETLASEIILPFSFQPIPTPVPWNKFTDPRGRFSFAFPPPLTYTQEGGESWLLGEQIRVEVLPFENSWITCFEKSLGDCPFVETDLTLLVNGAETRRITGYIGAVGGYIPQEFQTHIFPLGNQALVITVYALPFDTASTDIEQIWPLQGMYLEFFQRIVDSVLITN